MRRRLGTTLAVGVGAALLGGCGGGAAKTTGTTTPAGPVVVLNLKGGGNVQASACGSTHHYATYRAGTSVEFDGTVRPVPSGRWKVKVKVKVCRGTAFQELSGVTAIEDKHRGSFSGTLPALAPGHYFARASLYLAGRRTSRSDKRHVATR